MGAAPWRLVGAALGVVAVVAAVLSNTAGVAGSNPVATIGRVAASPPAGIRLARAVVAVWSNSTPVRTPPSLPALAVEALGRTPDASVSVVAGALGNVRWARATAGGGWSLVELAPPAPSLHQAATLTVMVGAGVPKPADVAVAAQALTRRVRRWGPPRVAVCASGTARPGGTPLAVARALASRMGAPVVEAVGGRQAAELLARLPGAAAVAVAGRPINVEVRVARTGTGLVVDIASPFVAPGGCTAPGGGVQAA